MPNILLTPKNTVLLVVDVQERLFPSIYMKDELVKNLQVMIRGAQILELPIMYTEHAPAKIGKTIPEIAQLLTEVSPISKMSFSCCGEKQFMKILRTLNRHCVLMAGIETHICVYQTTMDLANLGYHVEVVMDAVSSRTAQNKVIGIERIKETGGHVTSTETALCEMLRVAEGEKFNQILNLIK